jgi:Tfp pilus assembly protein PilF
MKDTVKWEKRWFLKAVSACKHALNLNPNPIQAHFYLAKAYLKIGDKDLALEKYEILKPSTKS